MIPIASVVYQHAEDAAFLWASREVGVRAPHLRLDELSKIENRIRANIDGLRIASEFGWEMAVEQLSHGDAGHYFATTVLALESESKQKLSRVLDAPLSNKAMRGVVGAFAWVDWRLAETVVRDLIRSEDRNLRRLSIAVYSVARVDPGKHLDVALCDADCELRTRACRAVGELHRQDLLGAILPFLEAEDEALRFWAAWSTTLFGVSRAHPILWDFARGEVWSRTISALCVLLRAAPLNVARDCLNALGRDASQRRAAVAGVGIFGDPNHIPWLVEQIKDQSVARLAGEAFSMITNVDVVKSRFDRPAPKALSEQPNDDPLDENVSLDEDHWLAWPDPSRLHEWWNSHADRFIPTVRHFCGRPISTDSVRLILRTGRQRERNGAAIELSLLNQVPLFETRARADRQRRLLA